MTYQIRTELTPDTIIKTVASQGIQIDRQAKLKTDWSGPRTVVPGQTTPVVIDHMGTTQLQELRWDEMERGELRTTGFADGYRPSFANRCLIPVRNVVHPSRLYGDETSVADMHGTDGEHGALWLAGYLLPLNGAGYRVFNILTGPKDERNEGASVIEPIIIKACHWKHWMNPHYSAGLLQHSPTAMRGLPPVHLAA